MLSKVGSHWRISGEQCQKATCFDMRVQAALFKFTLAVRLGKRGEEGECKEGNF